jgi:hypothetical protein
MKGRLTKLDHQNPIQGPVPEGPKKLGIEEVNLINIHGSIVIRTREVALKK